MNMKDLAPSDRPREKLWRQGPGSLGVNELIALVLGTGSTQLSALELSNELLRTARGMNPLARMSVQSLARLPGIKRAKAARLAAAFELGRRARQPSEDLQPLSTPVAAAAYLQAFHGAGEVEEFGVVTLDTRHRVKTCRILSRGTLDGTLVHPRDVFREALVNQAATLIVFHNHPSGDPRPSDEDMRLTDRLTRAGKLMGIELLDHIVLGHGRYFSFQEAGQLRKEAAAKPR